MIGIADVTLRRGDRALFEHLDLTIHAGQRVGLVGRNGVGKSTLFELLRGRLIPSQGDVHVPPRWVIGYMQQESSPSMQSALEWTKAGDDRVVRIERAIARAESNDDVDAQARLHGQFEDADGYTLETRAAAILSGLGFDNSEFGKPQQDFSGGWRIRLNLARTLMTPADLLLLDEPTNHLDLDALLWLESWLKRFAGTLVVIAHDRDFLDACTDHTALLENGRATMYRGNYSAFERARAENLARQSAMYRAQQREAKHIQSFIDRFRAKSSKAKQVQSRIKALERLKVSAPAHTDSPYRFDFPNPERTSRFLFDVEHGAFGYEANRVLEEVRFALIPGNRIGILGHNGAGKSTFMKTLAGELEPLGGTFKFGMHANVGYFAQHQLELLDGSSTPLEAITDIDAAAREQAMRDHLGGWGFPGSMVGQRITTLSGGEKARLVLALLAWRRPSILLLDEPTNHLDLEMRHALSVALQDYSGAMVLVSHDREFMARTIEDYFLADRGRLLPFDGDLDAYVLELKQSRSNAPTESITPSRKDRRRASADARRRTQTLRNAAQRAEARVNELSRELALLHHRLGEPDTYAEQGAAELEALLERQGKLRRELAHAEQHWLEQQERLERYEANDQSSSP